MPDESPHYLEHRKRLKERFVTSGIGAFQEYEIIELLLTYAIPRRDVKPLGKVLLERFHTVKGVLDADIKELEEVPGLKTHSAILIKLVKETLSVYLAARSRRKDQITCLRDLYDYCKVILGGVKDERFLAIYLDSQNRIIDVETIQEGIVNQAVVYPRKVLENALKKKASALILVHNHPSGEVRPSAADIRVTRTIEDTAKALNIVVNDHLIIGENDYFSFREEGIISGR